MWLRNITQIFLGFLIEYLNTNFKNSLQFLVTCFEALKFSGRAPVLVITDTRYPWKPYRHAPSSVSGGLRELGTSYLPYRG